MLYVAWLGHAYYLLDDLYPRQSSTTRSLVATPGRPATHTHHRYGARTRTLHIAHGAISWGAVLHHSSVCSAVVHSDHGLLCFAGLLAWA